MADDNILMSDSDKRAKAKLALSGDEKLTLWKKSSEDIEKRRQEAVKAMASDEQKKTWEEAEKARKAKQEAQEKLARLETERKIEEEEKRKKLSEEQIIIDRKKEEERLAKINEILKSQKEIDLIKKNPNAGPTPIKTLTRDISEAIGKENLSAGRIITNTPDKEDLSKVTKKGNNSWLAGIAIILVMAGLIVVLWSVMQRQIKSIAPVEAVRQGLIFANEQKSINLDKQSSEQIRQDLKTKNLTSATSQERNEEIYFIYQQNEQTQSGLVMKTVEANPSVMANKLDLKLPDEFLRFLDPQMMFGFYYGQKTSPYFIFKTQNYKNVADALLNNENLITSELFSLTNDASSTEKIKNGTFQDKMIRNYDTRLVLDETNSVIFLHSWLDKNTLIFTTSEDTFTKILNSYSAPKK